MGSASAPSYASNSDKVSSLGTGAPHFRGAFMSRKILALAVLLLVTGFGVLERHDFHAREVTLTPGYKVRDPIRHGNLTVFPVVAAKSYATGEFLTLDEGLRTGEVVVTEAGSVQGLMRRHGTPSMHHDGAQVNRLVLVNNSKRPLLLLAGEIVSGGKQDRVIGKDRIVPAESDPVDLSVFCVEPGRWTATSEKFGGLTGAMAQPAVRSRAMADKDQSKVWQEVGKSKATMAAAMPAPVAGVLGGTSSY